MACASLADTEFSDSCNRVEMCWVQFCKCYAAMQHIPTHKTGPFFSSSMSSLVSDWPPCRGITENMVYSQ